ncbi:hypothetical protein ETAA8_19370 [Anatilimnocola aggregata]|uniref:Uncharacterized protein n=1 Tax=Anatilimnocola aggregata TaxID=2528021 RepID=A0A517Y9E2_9BACT|nr:hypothetical protein [Anatilimnocola aggregata]QDU26853.1 hypothetical protein ETAA8_19370 [Anatilimnocola aggregata]
MFRTLAPAAVAMCLLLGNALAARAQTNSPFQPTTTLPSAPQPLDEIKKQLPGGSSALQPVQPRDGLSGLKVSKGSGTLPNQHGQVWREYDLTPYTSRIKDVAKPEQAVIDWILRETGTETWFSTPLGVLSADSSTLRVYHTQEVQAIVRDVVERFVGCDPQTQTLKLRIITISNPSWRSHAVSLLKPVDVQSSGVDAWLLSHENATVLLDQFKKRADYKELMSISQSVIHGQSLPLSQTQARNYTRWLKVRPDGWSGYDPVAGAVDEGFKLELSPLMSLDGRTVDAQFKCTIDQVEKLVNVPFDVVVGGQTQRSQIQVPQLVSWRLSERFRWPADQVLLLSCGVVASPTGETGGALAFLRPLEGRGSRSDALMLIEYSRRIPNGPADKFQNNAAGSVSTNPVSRGRY